MKDRFGRTIDYLRVSVTDRCDLGCAYCMPPDRTPWLDKRDILSFEEIEAVVRAAAARGLVKVRLTGGEPLVRNGIVDLVGMLAAAPGIGDLSMTTNGTRLAECAGQLAEAGLRRVNVHLDTTDPDRFRLLTRGGDLGRVLAGIEAALSAGLTPLKLNCVVSASSSEPDARGVARFAAERGLQARFIRRMNFTQGDFAVVQGGVGGDCHRCSRLRLSSDGLLRPCLFSDLAFSVRELGVERALDLAVRNKPETGRPCEHRWMHRIGG